ncbi:MAG TPA: isochorismate synthase [Egibacteraceae bacterium]|nr:isochorismate synthase [Egibacteraceae bacterium]
MPALVVRTQALDTASDLVEALGPRDGVLWTRGGEGLVGRSEVARLDVGTGETRFARAAEQLTEMFAAAEVHDEVGAPGCGPVAFASATFDAREAGSVLVVPAVVTGRRAGRAWRTVAGEVTPPLRRGDGDRADGDAPDGGGADRRIRYAGSSIPDVAWLEAVATAGRRIEEGALDKVVLARDQAVWSRTPFDQRRLARRLADRFPDCYTFCVDGLIGATPELLVRRMATAVESLVLAGTARRGTDTADDDAVGEQLLASEKERREHSLAVTSVAEVLQGRCADLTVDPEPFLLRLANVQHLATRVRGTLAGPSPPTALELVGALHPTAAVCGTPTAGARALIRELEGMDRGRYAGPVGWVDIRGDGEFGIALRCAQLAGARARLFAGSGIVTGSLPEAELEETRLKLRAMRSAFEGQA